MSGAVYEGGEKMIGLQAEAFKRFCVSNPIHPDVFPGVRKMEAEIVAMVLAIFNAPVGSAGVTTSGGTESILMAVLRAPPAHLPAPPTPPPARGRTEPEM